MSIKTLALLTPLLAAHLGLAQAQILIGQTAGFTGPVAAGVKETTDGARLYIDAVNARGGVNGEKIELLINTERSDSTVFFYIKPSAGIAPRSTYLKVIGDFTRWNDRVLVLVPKASDSTPIFCAA